MNRNILVTGATSGFGKAIAETFARKGDHLIVTGRREDRLRELAEDLSKRHGVRVLPLAFDVRDRNQVMQRLGSLPEGWTPIDILVNNAGLALGRDLFEEADLDDWDTMIDTNVKGLLYTTKAVLPFLRKGGGGHIINMGSIAGKEVYEKGNAYCASKHAVDAISKAMRVDLLKHAVKVTAIHPGAADTEFSLVRFKGDADTARSVYEGYDPLTAADVADVVGYCADLPPHVCLNEVVITCTSQANSSSFHKRPRD
jgi:3-hydroxy acid dehydrogenase/malonic semialdehyde reductase